MGLSDFERDLVEERSTRDVEHKSRESEKDRKQRHGHHHRSHRHREDDDRERGHSHRDEGPKRGHRHKRHHSRDGGHDEDHHRRKRRRSSSSPPTKQSKNEDIKVFSSDNEDEDEWIEKEAVTAPPEGDILDQRDANLQAEKVPRDAWMQEPGTLDIEVVGSKRPKSKDTSQFVGAKDSHEFKVHANHAKDLARDLADSSDGDDADREGAIEASAGGRQVEREVEYTFGDSGSHWRMTKLRAVHRTAEEEGKEVEAVAMAKYGNLRLFDDAREEQREMERRRMYGDEYVGKERPSGELHQERKMQAGIQRPSSKQDDNAAELPQGRVIKESQLESAPKATAVLDGTALNKLKAQMMKAKLRNAPNAAQLEEEYRVAEEASSANSKQPDIVVLNNMESRALASGRDGEVTSLTGKRARERGLVKENEDMSIEDMVRHERRAARGAGAGAGRELAERIAKDGKFVDDLEYLDENAEKLSKKVVKSDSQLRNVAIDDFSRMKRVLDTCPLCHHEDAANTSDQLPTAPVVSLATRTYLTLPTEPEVVKSGGGAVIVPIQHRLNLLECDEDEWEEIRNFMKSLTRHYDALGRGVLFYENAAHSHKKQHAALHAIPLPHHLVDTAPAYFKEAILSADAEWSQHKPIIDTLALSQKPGYGKAAFRKALPKEMPYFHVWFTLDGGMGHVVEDERRWPKGDLFAREVIGGMIDAGPERVKKQGRWERHDRRVDGFRKKWSAWDWTKALVDAG